MGQSPTTENISSTGPITAYLSDQSWAQLELQERHQWRHVQSLIHPHAVESGAHLLHGGQRLDDGTVVDWWPLNST
jgi:hypothetical protein